MRKAAAEQPVGLQDSSRGLSAHSAIPPDQIGIFDLTLLRVTADAGLAPLQGADPESIVPGVFASLDPRLLSRNPSGLRTLLIRQVCHYPNLKFSASPRRTRRLCGESFEGFFTAETQRTQSERREGTKVNQLFLTTYVPTPHKLCISGIRSSTHDRAYSRARRMVLHTGPDRSLCSSQKRN